MTSVIHTTADRWVSPRTGSAVQNKRQKANYENHKKSNGARGGRTGSTNRPEWLRPVQQWKRGQRGVEWQFASALGWRGWIEWREQWKFWQRGFQRQISSTALMRYSDGVSTLSQIMKNSADKLYGMMSRKHRSVHCSGPIKSGEPTNIEAYEKHTTADSRRTRRAHRSQCHRPTGLRRPAGQPGQWPTGLRRATWQPGQWPTRLRRPAG
jgi:hypothetical protein